MAAAKTFFNTETVESFDEHPIVQLDSKLSTIDAFDQLTKAKLHSAPVYDSDHHVYSGFFDVADMVTYVIESLRKTSEPGVEVPDTFMNLKDLLVSINRLVPDAADTTANCSKVVRLEVICPLVLIKQRNPFKSLAPNASIIEALGLLGTKGIKRLPIQDAVSGEIKKIISQSSINKFLLQHDAYSVLKTSTVKSTGLGLCDVFSVHLSSPAVRAFELMIKHDVSAIAVLDEDGTLVTSISDYDLRLMSQLQNFTLYGISVQEFISLVRPEKPSFLVSVGPDSKLADIPVLLRDQHVHRAYIIDASNKPLGVITMKDLLAHVLHLVKK